MPIPESTPTTVDLVSSLAGAMGDLDDDDRRTALAVYRLLAAGEPVTDDDVARFSGQDVTEVEERLHSWPGIFRDEDQRIVGFWGLAVRPLDPEYRLDPRGGGPTVYAWCAWDTLFLPVILDRPLTVTATDGLTGEPIHVEVGPDSVARVEPADTVVSFLTPNGPFDADVVASFCHKVLFFAGERNASTWIEAQPDELFVLSVADAYDVGRQTVEANYGDALTVDDAGAAR